MTPYAYTLGRDRDYIFPTLDAAVRYLVKEGYTPSRFLHRWDNSLRAHVAGEEEPQEVDLSAYMYQAPVDEAALRAELMVKVANDRARFEETYPHGRTGARISGDCWLCERSADELEQILAREVAFRSWKWKAL